MNTYSKDGFALLEVVIIMVIIAILITGGFYFKNSREQKNIIQTGLEAQDQAKDLKLQIEKDSRNQENLLNQTE
jgi:type II secretory pathway component PulJ